MALRNKQPGDIRCTFRRYRLKLPVAAQIENCKRLCAGWHNRFGACLTLDNDRLRALCRRLVDDQVPVDDCVWAIEAYSQYCLSDRWHVEHPQARKTLVQFFTDDRFEEWLDKGNRLRSRSVVQDQHRQADDQRKRTELQAAREHEARNRRIREYFSAQAPGIQAELLAAAWSRTPSFLKRVLRKPSIDDASIRAEIGRMMETSDHPGGPT